MIARLYIDEDKKVEEVPCSQFIQVIARCDHSRA